MKIGLLTCVYNCADSLDEVMEPWFNLSKKYDFIISVVSARFKEYEDLGIKEDNVPTIKKFSQYIQDGLIQYLEIPHKPDYEHNIRNLALNHLLKSNCDIIWLLDLSDEYYLEEQIKNIIEYINKEDNQFYAWFSIPFKNYIFDDKRYVLDFCPPRIFRTKYLNYKLSDFYFDNDIIYLSPANDVEPHSTNYKLLPSKDIPRPYLSLGIKHLTWLDNENSHKKVLYHEKHFSHGFGCSYKWEDGHLKFNEDYYRKTGQQLPIIHKDE